MPIHGRGFRFGPPDWPMNDIDDFIGRLDVLDQSKTWAGVVADYYWDTTPTPVTIPYAWLSPPFRSRADQPINDPAISVANGGTAYATNQASIARYGDFGQPITLTTAVPADADALAAYLSANYADFRMRCPSLTINLRDGRLQQSDVQRLLGVKVGDRISITGTPTTWPQGNNGLIVEGITKQMLIDRCQSITFNTSPVVVPTGAYLPFTAINPNPTFETGSTTGWAGVLGGTIALVTGRPDSLSDMCGRTVSNGLGSADTGQAYTTSGGSPSDYSVGSGAISIALNSVGASRKGVLPALSTTDFEAFATVSVSATATGAGISAGIIGRLASSTDYYMLGVQFTTAGTLLAFWTRVGGTGGGIVTQTAATGLSYSPGTNVNIHVQFSGSSHSVNVWTTGAEPSGWQLALSTSNAMLDPMTTPGIRAIAETGNTNVSPVVTFDNIVIPSWSPRSGSYAMTLTPDGVGGSPAAYNTESLIVPGMTYGYSVWLWSPVAWSYNVVLAFNDSNHSLVNNSITNATVVRGWTQVSGSMAAPSGSVYGQLQVLAPGTPGVGTVLAIDDATVYPLSQWWRWGSSTWAGPDQVPF